MSRRKNVSSGRWLSGPEDVYRWLQQFFKQRPCKEELDLSALYRAAYPGGAVWNRTSDYAGTEGVLPGGTVQRVFFRKDRGRAEAMGGCLF